MSKCTKNNMARKQIYVFQNPDRGGWDVKRSDLSRVSRNFDRKADAMAWAREQAIKKQCELVPHGLNGRIQNPNSYGNDPCPPHDTKF